MMHLLERDARATPAATIQALAWLPLHLAAQAGSVELVQQHLATDPQSATAADAVGRVPLHCACSMGHAPAAALLLAAAPEVALVRDAFGMVPAHLAAQQGSAATLQLVLEAAPQTASAQDRYGKTPLHHACGRGHLQAAELLLPAAPQAVWQRDGEGACLPLHHAAQGRHVQLVELLSAAAPQTLYALDSRGWAAIHWAAYNGDAASVRLICQVAPATAEMPTCLGGTPLHMAEQRGHLAVAEAPVPAQQPTELGNLPIHLAALGGHPEVAQLLLDAAPGTATAISFERTPLQLALMGRHISTARCFLSAGPKLTVLAALAAAGPPALPLFADFVIARCPLSKEEWAAVPTPCPGLGRALTVALSHSPAQAACLVTRLPAADVQRLRTAALCLACMQRRDCFTLPTLSMQHVLSLCLGCSDEPGACQAGLASSRCISICV